MKYLALCGSTGSIGTQALTLLKELSLKEHLIALVAGKNEALLKAQVAEFGVRHFALSSSDDGASELLDELALEFGGRNLVVINAIVGFAGLKTSAKALDLGAKLLLANKESLVAAGCFLDCSEIIPIDSEHAAIWQLLRAQNLAEIEEMLITASGGAFWHKSREEIAGLPASAALKHPTWSMGAKITIDSASMANKLFECLEAFHLFGFSKVNALREKSSSIHAALRYKNGSMSFAASLPDMKLAIGSAIYEALSLPQKEAFIKPLDLLNFSPVFEEIDEQKFRIFSLRQSLIENPKLGVLINAANDVFVQKYLNNDCGFLDIERAIFSSLDSFSGESCKSLEDVFRLNALVKESLA